MAIAQIHCATLKTVLCVLLCILLTCSSFKTYDPIAYIKSTKRHQNVGLLPLQMANVHEGVSNKVFIGNLSFKISEAEVKKLVVDLKCEGVQQISIPRGKKTKRGLGFAFVDFTSYDDAKVAAAKIDGTTFQDRQVNANVKDPESAAEKPAKKARIEDNSIYLANLDFSLTEEEIIDMCNDILADPEVEEAVNLIMSIEKPVNKETGLPRGFCYVEFLNPELVKRAALELNNVEVLGKLLYCMPMQKKSKKAAFVGADVDQAMPLSVGDEVTADDMMI